MEEATNEHNQRHAAIRSAFEGFHERIGASSNSGRVERLQLQ